MRSRTPTTMRQSATVVCGADKSFHYRISILPDCSSSRISRVDTLMPRGHSRLTAEQSAAQGRVERAWPTRRIGSQRGSAGPTANAATDAVSWDRDAGYREGWPRREPDCGGGDRASFRLGGSQGHGDPRDRSRGAGGNSGTGRTHGHGEQPDTEVHEPAL